MAIKNTNHIVLKLIMKHEEEFNALEPDHDKLREIERKVKMMGGYYPVYTALCHRNYMTAVTKLAETYLTDWNVPSLGA